MTTTATSQKSKKSSFFRVYRENYTSSDYSLYTRANLWRQPITPWNWVYQQLVATHELRLIFACTLAGLDTCSNIKSKCLWLRHLMGAKICVASTVVSRPRCLRIARSWLDPRESLGGEFLVLYFDQLWAKVWSKWRVFRTFWQPTKDYVFPSVLFISYTSCSTHRLP